LVHGSRLAAAPGSGLDLVRAGVLWDQVLALRALTRRDAGPGVAKGAGFYDVFGIEVTELFTGLIGDDPRYVAPRVFDHGEGFVLEPVNWMRGWCTDPSSGLEIPCRGDAPSTFPGPVVTPPPRTLLRIAAAAFALASLSTPTDPTFRLRASVYEVGADAFDVPDTQEDGSTSCGYGGVLSAAHADCTPAAGATVAQRRAAATSSDYIFYTPGGSARTYAAVKLRPRTTFNLEEEHTAFHLLLRASELQHEARALEALGSPTPEQEARLSTLRARLAREDAFVDVLVHMRRIVD
jgi:hypothetical protein